MDRFSPVALALLGLAFSASTSAESTNSSELERLRDNQARLEERIRELESAKTSDSSDSTNSTNSTKAEAPPRRASEGPPPYTSADPESKHYELGSEAPAPVDPFWRFVRLGVATTLQLDVIHDFQAVGLTQNGDFENWFVTADIPVAGSAAAQRDDRTGLSIQQTHWDLWLDTPTPWGDFEVFTKFNLTGQITGVAPFQVYMAYATWGWLRAGRDYTLFLNTATIPDTLDFEGPNAIPENRPLSLRAQIPISAFARSPKGLQVLVGIEDQPFEITPAAGGGPIDVNRLPALVAGLGYEDVRGRSVWLRGLYRHTWVTGSPTTQLNGWGVTLQAHLPTWKNDALIFGVLGGQALGAYIDDLQGFGLDAAPLSPTDARLEPIMAASAYGAYTHHISEALRSTVSYGYVWTDTEFIHPSLQPVPQQGIYKQAHYVSLNMIWSPIPPFNVGIEYLFGYREVTRASSLLNGTGESGLNNRLQITLAWAFSGERAFTW